jgi:multiple sugar transport system substrate-binding protein
MRARSFVVSQITGASAAGSLPDALAAVSLGSAHSLATDGISDPDVASKPCVDTLRFYVDLIREASVRGDQDATSTRAAYLAGKAAMVIWSSFLLDELAGLSNDAHPTCPQCHNDPSFLADHSGIVTAITGPYGAQPSQFGELTSFVITKGANKDAAKLVEFMMNDGYLDWRPRPLKARSRCGPGPPTSPTSSPMPGTTSRPASRTGSRCRRSTRPRCSTSSPPAPRR